MRVEKLQRGYIGRMSDHNARDEEYAKNNPHIDAQRTKNNRVLLGTSDPGKDLQDAIEGVQMARRGKTEASENVGAEILLTAHADYFKGLPPEALENWLERNMAWLQQTFDAQGRGQVVNVILHLDEAAPHIHAVIAPIVQKSRVHPVTKQLMPPKPQLNCAEIFSDRLDVIVKARKEGRSHMDTKLGRLQTSYAAAMAPCGLIRGKESMRTQAPDVKHIAPHIYRQIKEQIDSLENMKQGIVQNAEEWKKYRTDLMNECKKLENMRDNLKGECKKLDNTIKTVKNEVESLIEQNNTVKDAVAIYNEMQRVKLEEREVDYSNSNEESNSLKI
jgi:hypothetical protein